MGSRPGPAVVSWSGSKDRNRKAGLNREQVSDVLLDEYSEVRDLRAWYERDVESL
jgi:hypothetical protein